MQLVVLGKVRRASFARLMYLNQLHHSPVFMTEDVAMEHISADEIHELMPDQNTPGSDDCPVGLPGRKIDGVLPDLVFFRSVGDRVASGSRD